MRQMTFCFLASLALIGGCATMPGGISTHVSEFDGTREVYMEPAPLPSRGAMVIYIQLCAHWSSDNPETVHLIAQTPQDYTTIRREDGLEFNIDGEIVSLSSPTVFTDLDSTFAQGVRYTRSSRPFSAPLELVQRLAASEGVQVRMHIGQGEYYEARLETEGMNAGAYRSLGNFLEEVEQQKQELE